MDPLESPRSYFREILYVFTVVVTITLAYAALDKRISLMEQKLDFVVQRIK